MKNINYFALTFILFFCVNCTFANAADNVSDIDSSCINTKQQTDYNFSSQIPYEEKLLKKIDELNKRVEEINVDISKELKKINTKIDVANRDLKTNNINMNKNIKAKTFMLSKDMQKTFAQSTTRNLTDIPSIK